MTPSTRTYHPHHLSPSLLPRWQLVQGYLTLKLGVDTLPVEERDEEDVFALDMTIDDAIAIIQRNERGRQGRQRALMTKEVREEERLRR